MVTKNGRPVCTQYHYERDFTQFLPTVTLERGPVELVVTWPADVTRIPRYHSVSQLPESAVSIGNPGKMAADTIASVVSHQLFKWVWPKSSLH